MKPYKILLAIALLTGIAAKAQTRRPIPETRAESSTASSYNLAGRKTIAKPSLSLDCKEEGTVVIKVRVDRKGTVLSAEMAKGTTNAAKCLVDTAKAHALRTQFQAKEDATEVQEGTISYKFTLRD